MKKYGIAAGVLGMFALATGFSFAEWSEYARIASSEVREAISDSIPTEVELKRMDVLVEKVDAKVRDQKRIVAKSQIELEDAETLLAQSKSKCQRIKNQMVAMRKQPATYVSTCGTTMSTGSRQQLAILLSSYKTHAATLTAREKAVSAHRDAVAKLTARFNDWSLQRETLHQQLDSLKARHAAMQIARVDDSGFNDDEMSRAIELRKELESRIRVEERVDSDLTVSTFDWSASDNPELSIEDEVDAILAQ